MGFFTKEKEVPLLNDEDRKVLRETERLAYLEEAKKLVTIRGIQKANNELGIKKEEKKKDPYPWSIQ